MRPCSFRRLNSPLIPLDINSEMARYLPTPVAVCICLAISMFSLAVLDSGLARAHHVLRVGAHHRHHSPRGTGRRQAQKAKGTSATHITKRAAKKSGRPSGSSTSAPLFSASKSTTQTSPASESFPSEPFPAKSPTPKEPNKTPGQEPPANTQAPETSAPQEPTSTPVSEEPAKTPAPQEPPRIPAPEEPTTKESPPVSSRKLVWSDEFNGLAGASPGSQWQFDTGGNGWGNEELESYTSRPANAELDGQGHLAITALAEKYTGKDGVTRSYTSARLQTLKTFQFQYGLVEARIQVPAGQGLVAQFWALGSEAYEGSDAWPACGEIDTAEVLGSEPNIVNGTLHAPWPWAPTGVQGQAESATPLSAGFHTYSVEWEPEQISFMLDGSVYKTITPADLPAGAAWPFKHPYFLLMDLAVGGEWPGSPNTSTHFPAQMLVDWVRVWQ
jgi:beta-glucanase (GH16 family)